MPIRERLKRVLRRSSTASSQSDTKKPPQEPNNRLPGLEYYKPGEIPRSKYRGPWNQKHQDHLKAFSFTDAWNRRRSGQSQYSPHGSRMPSRAPSRVPSRTGSTDDGVLSRKGSLLARAVSRSSAGGRLSRRQSYALGESVPVEENEEGDDDVANGMFQRSTGH